MSNELLMALQRPQPPIVPSKNALRALRRLALSPSVYVVGTLSSICGIATLNYEVNRKVRLAEQVVERKRLLRSMSSGRGTAQLNAMFEAAERGDDFVRHTKNDSRRRISTRAFSAVALHEPPESTHDFHPDDLVADPSVPFKYVKYRRYRPESIPQSQASTAAVATYTHPVEGTSSGQRIGARKQEHAATGGRSGQPYTSKMQGAGGKSSSLSTASASSAILPNIPLSAASSEHLKSDLPPSSEPRVRFVNPWWSKEPPPVRKKPATPATARGDKRKSILKEQRGFPGLQTESVSIDMKSLSSTPATELARRTRPDVSTRFELLMQPEDDSIDQILRDHIKAFEHAQHPPIPIESLAEFTPTDFMEHAGKFLDLKTLAAIDQFIQPSDEELSKRAQLGRWLAVMRHSTQIGTPDWSMAEAVFFRYRNLFNAQDLQVKPVFELIRHLLVADSNSDRLQWILFPDSKTDHPEKDATEVFEFSTKYLTFFCEQSQNPSACFREMEKIIGLSRRCEQGGYESLVSPVFKTMARSRNLDTSEMEVLDMLENLFEPTEVPHVLGEYAYWQAREGNWQGVRLVLDKLHIDDYSRKAPSKYGRMFHRILQQFSAKNPALRSMQFTIDNIKYAGLIPTGLVSQTIICACIRERRYDLVTEWIRLTREAFPRVSLGFENAQGAWVLANTLTGIGASCQDVSAVSLRIALGRRLDPFDASFRTHATELVRLDLIRRLSAATTPVDGGTEIASMTLNQLFEKAYQFCTSPTKSTSKHKHLDNAKSDIAAQLVAIGELASIFRGDVKMLFARAKTAEPPKKDRNSIPPHRSHDTVESEQAFDVAFPQGSSTGVGEIAATVARHYASREKQGLRVNHSLLARVISTFGPEYPMEVLQLVEAIYASNFVQGPSGAPFDSEVFQKWLHLVTVVGSVKSATAALWAVLDSARHLKWTVGFSYLPLFASQVRGPKSSVWDGQPNIDEAATEELRYLQRRILHLQRHSLDGAQDDFRFPAWSPWEFAYNEALKGMNSSVEGLQRVFS